MFKLSYLKNWKCQFPILTIKKIIIVKIKNNEIMHLKKLPFNCKIYDKNNQLLNPTF